MDHEISFERFYRVLRDISASLHSDTMVKDVLDTVVRKSAEALNAKGAVIRILNLETHQLELFAAYGSDGLGNDFFPGDPSQRNISLPISAVRTKLSSFDDILHDPRIQYPKEAWAEGLRMAIDAPLTIGSDIIGILRFYFSEQREFSEEELNLVIHHC